jgi:hypothetical protein
MGGIYCHDKEKEKKYEETWLQNCWIKDTLTLQLTSPYVIQIMQL